MTLVALPPAYAQPEMYEDEQLPAGLVGEYRDAEGRIVRRVDRQLNVVWTDQPPDERLAPGPIAVTWRGQLWTQAHGTYQLLIHAAGHVRVTLAGKCVLDARAESLQWLVAGPLEVPFGWHPLQIEYHTPEKSGRLAVYWSGPQFPLEPVHGRYLFHDPKQAPDPAFERGRLLVRVLRCEACHNPRAGTDVLRAPSLERVAGNLHYSWLVDWLTRPEGSEHSQAGIGRRMPHFAMPLDEAEAIAVYLRDAGDEAAQSAEFSGDRQSGRKLFLTLGCVACHQLAGLGASDLFGGGDLTQVAQKRPRFFFDRWLQDPALVNPDHRMPVFQLNERERSDLAEFLSHCGSDTTDIGGSAVMEGARRQALVDEGRNLLAKYRCQACHSLPADAAGFSPVPWPHAADWSRACTGAPDVQRAQPGYRLGAQDAAAVRTYVEKIGWQTPTGDPAQLLVELGCVACHARNPHEGLASLLPAVVEHYPELAPSIPAMVPPSLESIGDKLHDAALEAAIGQSPQRRPWLSVRMPSFRLASQQRKALVSHLVHMDRIPEDAPIAYLPAHRELDGAALEVAGRRLVTPEGFGCTSCHQVGRVQPIDAPLATRGTDLTMLGTRIRWAWFDRWVRNPARLTPRMEMPAVQLPVRGVLKENLDHQLVAVWHVLNLPGFEPPQPNAVRVVRRSGRLEPPEPAVVLTDVLKDRGQTYVKPFLIGLPNRHNVLVDLETSRLAAWWIGDVARQRTQGKSWYWEPAGSSLWPTSPVPADIDVASDIQLLRDGQRLPLLRVGQFVTEFDSFQHLGAGIQLEHRLRFGNPNKPQVVRVVQQFLPIHTTDGQTGFERVIQVDRRTIEDTVVVQAIPPAHWAACRLHDDGRAAVSTERRLRLELIEPHEKQLEPDGCIRLVSQHPSQLSAVRLRYVTDVPIDQFPASTPPATQGKPELLPVVPGFDAVLLPLPEEMMPTALAWKPDGSLVIASLKGRIWLADDTDGDGLEDRAEPMDDELAAPYGLAAYDRYLDVINKYALVRLWDADGNGLVEKTETLASGWGHTDDYHDWAIGLPRDTQGNYYVGLPCQQDDRSLAAAHLRGTIVRLEPCQPDADTSHRFRIRPISSGHRFPMGLALSPSGELFVTDNQGNYNPFNELNHVQQGAHYGFINAIEARTNSPRPPLTPPAIDIPHPWTRSVNGICFLISPVSSALRRTRASISEPSSPLPARATISEPSSPLRTSGPISEPTPPRRGSGQGAGGFGPFEGHLVGCEYDTQKLIRMSLQKVEDTWQGAAYPLSLPYAVDGKTLLGPLTCAVSPDGALYVGCVRDSGWGGGNNIGNVVRLSFRAEQLPAGIAEVRAVRRGFAITFTRPVNAAMAGDMSNYVVSSYTRVATPDYGGDDQQRRVDTVSAVHVTDDALSVTLEIPDLREGFVYELRLKNLTADGSLFFPAEAFYTLRRIEN